MAAAASCGELAALVASAIALFLFDTADGSGATTCCSKIIWGNFYNLLEEYQIKEYLEFMTNDENVTTKNMVKVWRILSGQQMETGPTDNLPPSRADEKRQVPSAAAISGSAPPKPTAQKAQDEWIDGLMEFSKKY